MYCFWSGSDDSLGAVNSEPREKSAATSRRAQGAVLSGSPVSKPAKPSTVQSASISLLGRLDLKPLYLSFDSSVLLTKIPLSKKFAQSWGSTQEMNALHSSTVSCQDCDGSLSMMHLEHDSSKWQWAPRARRRSSKLTRRPVGLFVDSPHAPGSSKDSIESTIWKTTKFT